MTPMMSLLSEKINQVSTTDDGGFNYYPNNDETVKKLKTNAMNDTIRIQLSTGAYMLVVAPLISFWKKHVGKMINLDGLDVVITDVKRGHDANDTTTQWIVRLMVEGEQVTITCYDTQVKLMIQGAGMHVEYTNKALIPHLNNKIKDSSRAIAQLNNDIFNYDPNPKIGAAENTCENNLAAKTKVKTMQKRTRATSKRMLAESDPLSLTMHSPTSPLPALTSPLQCKKPIKADECQLQHSLLPLRRKAPPQGHPKLPV